MDTPEPGSVPVSPAPASQDAVMKLLTEFMGMAERGKLSAVLIGFVLTDGNSAIRSTPMAASMMNHLNRILDCEVAVKYRRAMAASEQPRSPTGAMHPQSPKAPEVVLPRKIRRQVQAQQRKLQKRAVKKAKLSGPPLPADA